MTQSVIIAAVRYIDLTASKACFIPDVSAHADCIGSIAHANPSTFGYRFTATVLQRSEVASTLANWALPGGSCRSGSRYRAGPVAGLAEVQEPGSASGEAGGRRGLGAVKTNSGHSTRFPSTAFRAPIATARTSRFQTARFLKSRNPHSVVKLKDLKSGEETVVAFTSGQ